MGNYSILSSIEIYRNQCVATYNTLSDAHFDAFNTDMCNLAFASCGCIDAPDQIPAGSMKSYGRYETFTTMSLTNREIDDIVAHNAIINDIIKDMLASLT